MEATSAAYAKEVRDYLIGRLEKLHADDVVPSQDAELPHRYLSWWLFEGKSYPGLEGALAREWDSIARQVRRLRAAHSPRRKEVRSPEGEIDWLASALASVTSGGRDYIARTTGLGLADEERDALEGWLAWISELWGSYLADVGVLPDVSAVGPLDLRSQDLPPATSERLRRWAHTARRSRWPLLRNVVAETLRAVFEPQEVDRLPLPTQHERLFELACLVRTLRTIAPDDRQVRWLDNTEGDNTVTVGGISGMFQLSLSDERVRASTFYPSEILDAFERQGMQTRRSVDLLFKLRPAIHGFDSLLLECKSGKQEPASALAQMHLYRTVLRDEYPGPMLVLGVVEQGPVSTDAVQNALHRELPEPARRDVFAFCSGDELAAVLSAAGLARDSRTRARAA